MGGNEVQMSVGFSRASFRFSLPFSRSTGGGEQFLRVKELAGILGVHPNTVYRHISRGTILSVQCRARCLRLIPVGQFE